MITPWTTTRPVIQRAMSATTRQARTKCPAMSWSFVRSNNSRGRGRTRQRSPRRRSPEAHMSDVALLSNGPCQSVAWHEQTHLLLLCPHNKNNSWQLMLVRRLLMLKVGRKMTLIFWPQQHHHWLLLMLRKVFLTKRSLQPLNFLQPYLWETNLIQPVNYFICSLIPFVFSNCLVVLLQKLGIFEPLQKCFQTLLKRSWL